MTAKIETHSVVYHRNGIGGEGFYLVSFTHGHRPLMAVGWGENDPSCVAVFDPKTSVGTGHPEETYGGLGVVDRFRGADHYGPAILEAICEATARWDEWYQTEHGRRVNA